MKNLLTAAVTALSLGALAACGSDDGETGDYDPADYDYTLMSTSGEETEVFEEDEQELHLYFTGVD